MPGGIDPCDSRSVATNENTPCRIPVHSFGRPVFDPYFLFLFLFISGWPAGFLLLRLLSCSQNGDHPESNLAKFGWLHIRYLRYSILLHSWLPSGSYHLTLAIWNFKISKSGEFGPFFP
jgi:hypothetical protein